MCTVESLDIYAVLKLLQEEMLHYLQCVVYIGLLHIGVLLRVYT